MPFDDSQQDSDCPSEDLASFAVDSVAYWSSYSAECDDCVKAFSGHVDAADFVVVARADSDAVDRLYCRHLESWPLVAWGCLMDRQRHQCEQHFEASCDEREDAAS